VHGHRRESGLFDRDRDTLSSRRYELWELQIDPGNSATSALEPVAADSIALTGNPESGQSYLLTFHGWAATALS